MSSKAGRKHIYIASGGLHTVSPGFFRYGRELMHVELHLNNPYYPWNQAEFRGAHCYYKGTFFRGTDVLSDAEVIEGMVRSCSTAPEMDRLRKIAAGIIGEFCIVIETDDHLFCISDRIRSIPLFYALDGDRTIVTDDANIIRSLIHPSMDPESAAEFLVTGYVTGDSTLFRGLRQTDAGEILVVEKRTGSIHTTPYYRYLHGDYYQEDGTALMNALEEILCRAFTRLMASSAEKGQQIAVPLSGGLDSRIVAAMLRRVGAEDVVCYNYGHPTNRESRASKKVAEALGYPWRFVEYTQEAWEECYTSPEMRTYQRYGGNLASEPHIQDFFAVQTLKNEGIVHDNAVFVPGHAGDMLSGSHIPASYLKDGDYSQEKVIDDLLTKHYSLLGWNHDDLRSLYSRKIAQGCGGIRIHDNDSCANALEYFDFYERQTKFIVNAIRLYEFFGYSWSLPFWDAELIDFYLHVPLRHRIGQRLYKRYARERLFVGKYESLRRIECTSRFETPMKNLLSDVRRGPFFLLHLIRTGGQKTSWYNKMLPMLEENRLPLPDVLMQYPDLVSLIDRESMVPEVRLNSLIVQNYLSLILPDDGIPDFCP